MHLVHTLPAALPRINPWYTALFVGNAIFVIATVIIELPREADWNVIQRAAGLAGDPALYRQAQTATFVWSPLAAHALQLIAWMDVWAWRVIIIAAALALPTWRIRIVVLISWPFWTDIAAGNILTLTFLASVWALRGWKVATFAFFNVALLRPMPLLLPMFLWLLWKRPEWRLPVAGMVVVHGLLILWTGLGPEWIGALLEVASDLRRSFYNVGPTRFVGYWWLLAGLPIGAWLLRRGHVGLAGLAISPYVWSYYLFWALPWVNSRIHRSIQ